MRIIIVVLSILVSNELAFSQVLCSNELPKVFFGPNNVISKNSNPSDLYISELTLAIDSLSKVLSSIEVENEIETLLSIKQDWLKWSDTTLSNKTIGSDFEVKEFFNIKDQLKLIETYSYPRNNRCLYSNPYDCIPYYHIRKYQIQINDDFGNHLNPDVHQFYNVGFEGDTRDAIFYRIRTIEDF